MTTEAKLREALKRSHDVLVLIERAAPGYDWNADIEGLTLVIGRLYTEIKEALALPTAPPEPMSEEVKEALDCLEGRMTHAEGSDCECGLVVAEYIRRLHARSGAEQAVIDAAMNVKSHVGPNHRCSLECSVLLEMFDALIRLAAERRGEG